ncbi:MAG: hypothetical protein J7J02_07185 [Sulfurovum sp.]|nr:hypothetical protein [Sulfurovum sp.]
MKKLLLIITILTQLLFSATPEQIERYISISNSEEQLITLESQFSQMQNNINSIAKEETSTYDMQLLSIRFREYLQKNMSENEIDEIMVQYKNVVLLQFVSVQNDAEYDEKEAEAYMKELQTEENASVRMNLLDEISEKLYKKENIGILFDSLMKPLMQNSKNASQIDDETMKKSKEAYIKRMIASGKVETAYSAREFTIEELEELLKIVKTPAIDHESKVIFSATAYALREFFLSMASRYDVSKH